LLGLGEGSLPDEILMIDICERFGWDYYQFLEQPSWFIELIVEKVNAENREMKRREKEKG
jgi:hypothetical protein